MDGRTLSLIGMVLLGLVLILLVVAGSRLASRLRPPVLEPVQPSFTQIQAHKDAVLILELGGRIQVINDIAREWFNLTLDELPNIEALGRRIRPSESFLELCATEGQARFSINGKLVNANSYRISGTLPTILMVMRPAEMLNLARSGQDSLSAASLKTVSEFGQAIASSLSLEDTIESILINVEKLVPSDFLEVKIPQEATNQLVAYRMAGPMGAARKLQIESQSQFGEYSNYLVGQKVELFIPDTRNDSAIKFDSSAANIPSMGSYIGIPLNAYGQLVGTLEVGVTPVNGFSVEDLNILQLVTGQAAVAIRNSVLYEVQQRWSSQLLGLTNLSQAVGSLRDIKDLFSRLVAGLSPLFDVGILGFLLYDEQRRTLEGQMPFNGLPNNIVQIYKTIIHPNSPAEKRILGQDIISTLDASQDLAWADLGLQDLAQAASMRDTVLVPLVSAGRFMGYLQLSNRKTGWSVIQKEELRLWNIVANQVAAIIDNTQLVHQARQRNQRAEAMRRISSLASSAATLDEILRYSVQEIATLLQAEFAAIFLVDEGGGRMQAHMPSAYGIPDDVEPSVFRFNLRPSTFRMTVAGSQRSFVSGNLSQDRRVLLLYRKLVRRFKLESCINVPLVVRGEGIGELMLVGRQPEMYSNYDLQVASTVASQLAIAIEGSRHAGETGEMLRHRASHLTAMSRIARELNSSYDLKELIRVIYDESLDIMQAECGTVLLFEPDTSGSKQRRIMTYLGHTPADELSASMRGILKSGEPLLMPNLAEAKAPHSGINAVLLAPICYQDDVFGLIEVHARNGDHFDATSVEILRNIGAQAAVAIGNSLRYAEQQKRNELFRRRAVTLLKFFDTAKNLEVDQPLEKALEIIASGIQASTPFDVALVSLYNAETGLLQRVTSVGLNEKIFANLVTHQQPWSSVTELMKPEFEVQKLYFIPHDQTPVIPTDVQTITVLDTSINLPNAWNPEDLLLVPIYDHKDNPLGLISVDKPRDQMRPDQATFEALEIFAAQAGLIISSAQSILKYKSEIGNLAGEVGRQEKLVGFSQSSMPILLHKDLDQTISISHLNQRARHIRAGLQLTEAISRQIDSPSALLTLGQQILTSFDMSVSIVARETPDGPRIIHTVGNLPRGANPEALFGQRNPLRVSLQTSETLMSVNLDEDEVWHDTPFLSALRAKSFICIPVVINNKPIAAVLATDSEAMPALSPEDRQVYFQISRQISIILQNISLLNETRQRLQEVNLLLDFSRQLSGLNPQEILRSLLDSALRVVTPAHAGAVMLWNRHEELLVPQAAANYPDDDSIMGISYHAGEGLPGRVFAEKHARLVNEVNFASDYNLPAENLLRYRKATGGRLPVSSLLVPIQASEQDLGVLVLDNFNTPSAFRSDDEALLLSLTQQVALSLENVRLVETTQERAGQLQALNSVAATLTSSLNRDELVNSLLDGLRTVIHYDTATLWLRQEDKLIVAATRGFDDNEERKGISVAVEDSALMHEMIHTGQAISVGDIRGDPRFPSLVEQNRLSWLGIPLITKGQVIGLVAMEKVEPHFYNKDMIQLGTTFASQAAVAMDNANLFEESVRRAIELDERSKRLALLNEFSSELGGSLNSDQTLNLTASHLLRALSADRAMVIMLDPNDKAFLVSVLPDESGRPSIYRSLPASPMLAHLRETLSVFTAENVRQEERLVSMMEFMEGMPSVMVLPISSSHNLYAIAIQTRESRRFLSTEIELARTFGNQASIALENADLYQSTLATAERLVILNEVSYDIGASLDTEDIYRAIHDAVGKLMPVDAFLIMLDNGQTDQLDGVYVVDMGQRIADIHLPYGQGISGRVIESGQPILTLDSAEADVLGGITTGQKPHSILTVPMTSGGKVIGALSAQSYQFNAYTESDQQILGTLANQATVAIQNARLFNETQQLASTLEIRVIERTAELEREQRNTETLLRILTEVSASLDLDRALSRTLALLNEATGAEQSTIMLLHPEDNLLHYRSGYGYVTQNRQEEEAVRAAESIKLKIGEGLAGWVVKHRQPVMVEDLYQDPRWVVSQGSQSHRSSVAAPLIVGEDVIGAIMVFHRHVGFFGQDVLEMVKAIGSQVAISINNAQLYELIRDQAERLGSMLRQQQVEASRQTAILEAVADGVLVTDPGNFINFVNASAETILSMGNAQLVDNPLENFAGLFGKSTHTWIQKIREWSENPGGQHAGETYAEPISLDNGRVVLVHLAPVIWHTEFLGTVSIFRDITHEVEVDRLKSEFVATVSHELRTPMTSIRGYVDVLLMGAAGALSESQTHFLDIIKSNTERLNILVGDLLDISRIEAGRVTLSLQSVDLREVAKEIVADVQKRSLEENKPMQVAINANGTLPRVLADPERIHQILSNIVDNAYNYTPENGEITISLHQDNDVVQVDVKDTGIGISVEQHDRVFERFFRGEDPLVLATPGTGLGLPIVKQLVEMHHGKIWMDSTGVPGEGSTFSFTVLVEKNEE
jgi:GAF domain-containing protein/nitrogen-specific signal transduction histidine kinase